MKPNIVIDTNIIIAALRSKRGASNRLLRLFGTEKFIHSLSVPLILEYEAVIKHLFPTMSIKQINDLLDYICKVSQHTVIYYLWRPCLKDPKDDMVLELAVAAKSDFIVTFNEKDFALAKNFGIKVIRPKGICSPPLALYLPERSDLAIKTAKIFLRKRSV